MIKRQILCFDIGGTYLKYGIIDEEGNIVGHDQTPTKKMNCKEEIPAQLVSVYVSLSKLYDIEGIAISTAGMVSPNDGTIFYATDNLPHYTGTDLVQILMEKTGLPVRVINDANSVALGEKWLGAGKDVNHFVCLTVGTGIGGAIIINGEVLRGVENRTGMIGHMVIHSNGRPCNCGGAGCFEAYCSMSGLISSYLEKATSVNVPTGKDIVDLVKAKDSIALDVFEQYLDDFATGIINLIHLLNIGHFIIGGAFSKERELFIPSLEKRVKEKVMIPFQENIKIEAAMLENIAGIVGARALFHDDEKG